MREPYQDTVTTFPPEKSPHVKSGEIDGKTNLGTYWVAGKILTVTTTAGSSVE